VAAEPGGTVSLVIGVLTAIGISVTPVIVALIAKWNGRAAGTGLHRDDDPDWVSRAKYDALLEDVAQADEVNETLGNSVKRLDRDLLRAQESEDRKQAEIDRLADELGYLRSRRTGPRRREPRHDRPAD
jgi:hypothetical protein